MSFKKIVFFLNSLFLICLKNIILPFKKISIEDFNGRKTIDDLITYHIYTNISMGTPPQIVAHFIEQNDYSFHFEKRILSYNYAKYSKFLGNFEHLSNFWFNSTESSSFISNEDEGFYSDIFYFDTLNNSKIKINDLRHNIYLNAKYDNCKCGILGLNPISNTNFKINKIHINFLEELKEKELISEYSFTILYENTNSLFHYNSNLNLGKIIIGESPHIFNQDKFKKDDEIINLEKSWSILINELKFNSPIYGDYLEENIEMQISFSSGFIQGSTNYRKEIDKSFFNELIKNKLCKFELLEENVFPNEYYLYSCENNKEIQEKIKSFPSLNLEVKTNNLTFIFTYKDLFKLYDDRLFFMIIYKNEKYKTYVPIWIMGEIFLRKYMTTYNFDAKTFIFYRNQVDEVNSKGQIYYKFDNKKKINFSKYIRTFIEVLMALFIVFILYLFYRKFRNIRKIHANELEDSNFVYESHDIKNSILSKKDRELNKIIN